MSLRRIATLHVVPSFPRFGAGRGSDTKGAGARNTRPTLRVLEAGRRKPGIRLDRRALGVALVAGLALWLLMALCVVVLILAAREAFGARSTLSRSTIAFWDGVAKCETGSHWRGLGPTYQGGLGIYAPNWDQWAGELGLERRYPDAGDAPRLVQIRVADYGRRVHNGGWGCI